jgi:hypothetical protein
LWISYFFQIFTFIGSSVIYLSLSEIPIWTHQRQFGLRRILFPVVHFTLSHSSHSSHSHPNIPLCLYALQFQQLTGVILLIWHAPFFCSSSRISRHKKWGCVKTTFRAGSKPASQWWTHKSHSVIILRPYLQVSVIEHKLIIVPEIKRHYRVP